MNAARASTGTLIGVIGFCMAGSAAAQRALTDAYLLDTSGVIVKTQSGICVRTSSWTPQKAVRECDPSLFPAEKAAAPAPAPAPAPAIVAPPPPPPVARVVDSDNDGVPDTADRCPGTPAGARVDAQGCELDSDGDGVVDRLDKCPGTARGVKVDAAGCEIAQPVVLRGVNFETDSARLTPDSFPVLDAAAATLIKRGDVKVEVAGHTDSSGGAKHNQVLSQRRADAVKAYLVSKGVPAANLTSRGYGATQPIADNKTASGRAANRRVELRQQ